MRGFLAKLDFWGVAVVGLQERAWPARRRQPKISAAPFLAG
jgi:hypothetical protein